MKKVKSFLTYNIPSRLNIEKIFYWSKLITITGSAQVIIQVTSLVSGLLVIRYLPTREYAFYTLAYTMLGTMTVLADSGIASGVMAIGGKTWNDREKLGIVSVTGLQLRKKFGFYALLVSVPVLLYLLLKHGASLGVAILLVLSLIPLYFANLSDTILEIPLKLKQAIGPLQKNLVGANLGRLVLTGLTAFLFPLSYVALLAGGIPRIYANILLKKKANVYADLTQKPDPEIRKQIFFFTKRILPSSIYYCISGQITIWLISIFGTTDAIAQVGALSRLGMLFNILTVIFVTLVVPRFARLPGNKKLLINRYVQLQLLMLALSAILILLVSRYPAEILWILGEKYKNLDQVVVIAMSSSIGSFILGSSYSLATARGWLIHPAVAITIGILTQLILIFFVNFSTIKGVYYFSILYTVAGILLSYLYILYTFQTRKTL